MAVKNQFDDMSLDLATSTRPEGSVWTPRMPGPNQMSARIRQLEEQHVRSQRRGPRKMDSTTGKPVVVHGATPRQIISCQATEAPLAQVDRVYSQVAVSFIRDPRDTLFQGVHVWASGYHGNANPVLVADSADSPCVFVLETTQENVKLTVQAYGLGRVPAPFAGAPSTSIALSGQTTAPPAPTIASQTATITSGAVTVGQQMAFNYLPASLSDVIDGYYIYRTSSHSTPGIGSRYKYVKASVQNGGVYTLVDSTGVSTFFYYVSAINKQGLESSLTDATPASGGTQTIYRPSTSTAVSGGGYATPSSVWDGNSATYSLGSTSSATLEESWQGWSAAAGSPTQIVLYVISQALPNGGACKLEYSTNGGSTYTQIYNAASNRAKTTDTVTLSNAQNLTQVIIRATTTPAGGGHQANHYIYESYVTVNT